VKQYAIEFSLHILGYRARQVETPRECNLFYGDRAVSECSAAVFVPEAPQHGALWQDALKPGFTPDPVLPFDVVRAIGLLLTDSVNRRDVRPGVAGRVVYDNHDRLAYPSSWQAANGCGEIPVVNAYVAALGRALKRMIPGEPLPLWPAGKCAAIGLSHDVDRLDLWAELKGCLSRPNAGYIVDATRSIIRNTLRRHDDFGLFRDLIRLEAELGFRSTFLFASVNRYQKGGDFHDVAYDIAEEKVRDLFDYILSRDFEIGLHSSYCARAGAAARFSQERLRLEKFTGTKVLGQRHHFWHTAIEAEQTIAHHEEAGFGYDSSIAFNDHLGFRRNVALPYHPWLPAAGRPVQVLELPVFCMDGNVFYRPGQRGDGQADQIRALVATLKEYGGVGVLDWHSDTSHPKTPGYQTWGACYLSLLRTFTEDSTLWVTSLGQLSRWIEQRQARLRGGTESVPAPSTCNG
jgi:hypothetical protein